jgi:hypothetical protein
MTHTFGGKRYKIKTERLDGFCDSPRSSTLELHIFADMRKRNGLVTAVHEAIHATHPRLREDTVERMGKEIGEFLWQLGFRRKKV